VSTDTFKHQNANVTSLRETECSQRSVINKQAISTAWHFIDLSCADGHQYIQIKQRTSWKLHHKTRVLCTTKHVREYLLGTVTPAGFNNKYVSHEKTITNNAAHYQLTMVLTSLKHVQPKILRNTSGHSQCDPKQSQLMWTWWTQHWSACVQGAQ